MAQHKKIDKRNAILAAATELIAAQGLSAPTAKIARAAGVSDGSLFTYFVDKDDLLNQLFVELKAEVRDSVFANYPDGGTLKEQARHLWDVLVDFGLENPAKRRAIAQLKVSDRITEASREATHCGWGKISNLMESISAQGPSGFSVKLLLAVSELTIDSMLEFPDEKDAYRQAGFKAFWNAFAV